MASTGSGPLQLMMFNYTGTKHNSLYLLITEITNEQLINIITTQNLCIYCILCTGQRGQRSRINSLVELNL